MNATARNCKLLTLASLVLLAAAPVAADTYQVDRTDDTIHSQCDPYTYPDCSLRGAIIKANNHAGDDTVVLGSHTYTLSIFGRDEETIRKYIKHQQDDDRRTDQQLNLPGVK